MYDLSYDLVGFIFLVILTCYFFCRPIFPNLSNKYYRLILIISIVSVGLNVLTGYTINYSTRFSIQLNYALNMLLFFASWTLPYILYEYTIVLTMNKNLQKNKFHKALWIYHAIQSLIIFSSPLTHFIIYFDSDLVYHHGSLFIIMSIINFVILCISGIIVITLGQKMPTNQRVVIPSYIILIIGLDMVQFANPTILINGLALAVATFLMFLTLQNPISYFDPLTPNYSRNTFLEYLEILTLKNKPFQIIIVDISSTSKINKTFGEKNGTNIIYRSGQKIKWASQHNLTFRIRGDVFIVVTFSLSERDKVISNLESEFPFKQRYTDNFDIDVNVHLNYTNTLQNFEDIDEAYQIILASINISKEKNLSLIDNEIFDSIVRQRKIEIALKNSIENQDVKIYLQPIVNTKTTQVTNAEALVRIYDKELGLIMPDEFIPIAERDGNITKLTPLIIKGVCKYISESHFPEHFNTISINLSVIDCINPDLDKFIFKIFQEYNINPAFIVFEVTETIASIAPELKNTMMNIKKAGSRFALDDFGSGFANLDTVLKLPFDIIKIDKQLLRLSHNKQYKLMFTGIMDTLHSLNLETIVEGIETEIQAAFVKEVNATFQQGYLYSKPLSLNDFSTFINQTG
jgi:EAL domain-containing protein (putative c-di-GMP-specific phosphodiesterase class I)/GGDEF domain-containing protein